MAASAGLKDGGRGALPSSSRINSEEPTSGRLGSPVGGRLVRRSEHHAAATVTSAGVGVADISEWSAALATEARRLERQGLQADRDSVLLLRQQAEKMARIKDAMEIRDTDIRRLRAQVADLGKSRDALQVLRSQVELLEDRCKLRDEQAQEARAYEREQQGLLQRSMEVESTLRAKLAAMESSSQQEGARHEKQIAELHAQVAALQADAERREAVRMRLEDGLKATAKKEATFFEREETLSSRIRSLQADLERARAAQEEQTREMDARAHRIADLQTEATLLTSRLRQKNLDIAAAENRAEEREQQMRAELAALEEKLEKADGRQAEMRQAGEALEGELAESRDWSKQLQRRVEEEQRAAQEADAAHADAMSDLQEQLRIAERQLAQARDEHETRASAPVAAEHARHIDALQSQLERAQREAAVAHEDAIRASSASDSADRRVLQVVARVTDNASALRQMLQRVITATSEELLDYGEAPEPASLLLSEAPELPEPANVAMSTLAVSARSASKAVREAREREFRMKGEVDRLAARVEEAERGRRLEEEDAAELRKALRECESALHKVESESESALREATRSLEDLHQRCTDAEGREQVLEEAVQAAAEALFAVPSTDICKLRGDIPPCSTPAVSYKSMPENLTVSALQVILAEQVQRVTLSHRQLVAAYEHSVEEHQRQMALVDEAMSAAQRSQEEESAARRREEAATQAREESQHSSLKQEERHQREIQELQAMAARDRQQATERLEGVRAELHQEVDTCRGTSLRLLAAVQLLARFTIPLRLRYQDLRSQKAFLTRCLKQSTHQIQQMENQLSQLLSRFSMSSASGTKSTALALPSTVSSKSPCKRPRSRRLFAAAGTAIMAAHRLLSLFQVARRTRGASSCFGRPVIVKGELVGMLPPLEVYGGHGASVEERILAVASTDGSLMAEGNPNNWKEETAALVQALQSCGPCSFIGSGRSPPLALALASGLTAAESNQAPRVFEASLSGIEKLMREGMEDNHRLLQELEALSERFRSEKEQAAAWEREVQQTTDVLRYLEKREEELLQELRQTVPLEEYERLKADAKRASADASSAKVERETLGKQLSSQLRVAGELRQQLSEARETVHGKIIATDRLGNELQKERAELQRLREQASLQEAHHRRLQEEYTGLAQSLERAQRSVAAARTEVDECTDLARVMEQRAHAAEERLRREGGAAKEARASLRDAQAQAQKAQSEAASARERLRIQADTCTHLSGRSADLERQLIASRDHASLLQKELQGALDRELSEREDRQQWARARSELQAVRSAAEGRLAQLINATPANANEGSPSAIRGVTPALSLPSQRREDTLLPAPPASRPSGGSRTQQTQAHNNTHHGRGAGGTSLGASSLRPSDLSQTSAQARASTGERHVAGRAGREDRITGAGSASRPSWMPREVSKSAATSSEPAPLSTQRFSSSGRASSGGPGVRFPEQEKRIWVDSAGPSSPEVEKRPTADATVSSEGGERSRPQHSRSPPSLSEMIGELKKLSSMKGSNIAG